ncbi:family A G protein-coupled receptor-like protein [Penicillium lagena]|nr:family A G protein-coupled receptor-like protein [Penicillium lagena]KAJ5623693.1 family A G protein-coupled receptor-like protein [Penicillium lagena]
MGLQLHRRYTQSALVGNRHSESLNQLRRVVGYMAIYPIAYIILSLPLAIGRMATTKNRSPSALYFCVAGTMMASSGLVDVLVYSLTPRRLLVELGFNNDRIVHSVHDGKERKGVNPENFTMNSANTRTEICANCTNVTAHFDSTGTTIQSPDTSPVPMGQVHLHRTFDVNREP